MRILITGGSGFIGAWTARRLAARGHAIKVMDREVSKTLMEAIAPSAAAAAKWREGDVADRRDVASAAADTDLIIHLAALLTPACQEDPLLGARVNMLGTLNVFEAALERGHSKVLYVSSAGVFGPEDGEVPFPITNYGAFKLAGEGCARAYFHTHGLSSLGLRPLIVYGPGREVGLTAGPTLACKAAAAGLSYDIPFAGESGFVYVDDVAAVFEAAVRSDLYGAEVYNMGGEVAALSEVARLIGELQPGAAIGVRGEPIPTAPRIVDNGLYQRFVGVEPTALADGLRQTLRFYRTGTV